MNSLRVLASVGLLALAACSGSKSEGVARRTPASADDDDGATPASTPDELVDLIDTSVDPDYVYPFEQAKLVPPDGQVLLVVGQTLGGIEEHVASFPDQPLPGGWAAYFGVPSLDGVTTDFLTENGGTQNHQTLVDDYPNTVVQSAMWMVGTWGVAQDTGDGVYDDVVRGYADWVKSAERPVYLRIGYEFDGPHNELEPEEYVRAYRHVVDILREEGVDDVAYVWHSYAAPTFGGDPVSAWYPGDDYVDWVGISLFGHMYADETSAELDAVLDFARDHHKPVMVAEASPINGIPSAGSAVWTQWFARFFSFAYEKNIKALSFINEDWTRFDFPGLSWRDARLQNNELVADAWFLETNRDRYLKQSPELFDQLADH